MPTPMVSYSTYLQAVLQLVLHHWAGGDLGGSVAGDFGELSRTSIWVAGGGVHCFVLHGLFKVETEGFFVKSLQFGIINFLEIFVSQHSLVSSLEVSSEMLMRWLHRFLLTAR